MIGPEMRKKVKKKILRTTLHPNCGYILHEFESNLKFEHLISKFESNLAI